MKKTDTCRVRERERKRVPKHLESRRTENKDGKVMNSVRRTNNNSSLDFNLLGIDPSTQ